MKYIRYIKSQLYKLSDWSDEEYDAMETYQSLYQQAMFEFINDLIKGKKFQSWRVVPAEKIKQIWFYFGKTGIVRDEEGLNKIVDIISYNVAKIDVNNVMTGHTQIEPLSEVDSVFGLDSVPKKIQKQIKDYKWDYNIEDNSGASRISDYGIEPLQSGVNNLLLTKSSEDKLYAIDRILNVVHQRSDIASWFIEGGTKTLTEIFTEGQIEVEEDGDSLQKGFENYKIKPQNLSEDEVQFEDKEVPYEMYINEPEPEKKKKKKTKVLEKMEKIRKIKSLLENLNVKEK